MTPPVYRCPRCVHTTGDYGLALEHVATCDLERWGQVACAFAFDVGRSRMLDQRLLEQLQAEVRT